MGHNTFQRLRLIDQIPRSELSRGASSVLALIERRAGGRWWQATGDFIAAAVKSSRRSVVRWIAELVAGGFIAKHRRSGIVNGVRIAAPSRYRVIGQAVVNAASADLAARGAKLAAKMREAVARVRARLVAPAICAKVAQSNDQTDLRLLWNMLINSREGSPEWEAVVAGLISAGQGNERADFVGMGGAA